MQESSRAQLWGALLLQLSMRGDLHTFARGEVLIREGEVEDSLFILVSGDLKVFTRGDNGRDFVYNVLRPGEFFGEMCLDGGPRLASVRAVCTSVCVVIKSSAFREFIDSCPEFWECLALKLISRVRNTTELLRGLATKDVYERTAALLNEIAVEDGNLCVIEPPMTQQEIADRIGATREMVNHIFRGLVRGGFLKRDGRRRIVLSKKLPKHW